MAHVIIVSNRLPVSVKKVDGELVYSESIGGLATALSSYIKDRRNKWIGWPGIASEELTEDDKQQIIRELAKRGCSPVFLTRHQIDDFYNGYSNSVLWPLFHNLPFKLQDAYKQQWHAYKTVNACYAEAIFSLAGSRSRIWVHDYQLMLVPKLVREARPDLHTGFFLHIPFPTVRQLAKIPEHAELVKGLLGADLVGLHTPSYVANFLANCQALPLPTYEDHVIVGERSIRVTDFPIGIDYDRFADAHKQPAVKEAIKRYKRKYRGKKVIAATERLDISKGFMERLRAYREFLRQTPKLQNKVVFVLVGAPSRTDIPEYQRLARRVQKLVDEINAEFGNKSWQPVDYISEIIPFEEVTAILRIADVAFIAPLKDGMNLVPKEFIASRRKRGVLILSQTAGAAEELQDALLVNPYKLTSLVTGLQQAFTMSKREQRRRFRSLQRQVSANTVQDWTNSFVKALQQPITNRPIATKRVTERIQSKIISDYHSAERRLLLLDYDGSLVPFNDTFAAAIPPKKLLQHLHLLSSDPRNQIVIISGRSATDLTTWFDGLPVTLIAEHGAMIKTKDSRKWQTTMQASSSWQAAVLPLLEKYAALTPKADIEKKAYSLVWHYRKSPPYYAQKYLVVLKRVLKPVIKKYELELSQGNKILEVKNPSITKGMAIANWLSSSPDFLLAVGDDYTDEDMFAVLPLTANTIKVGQGRTLARFRVTTVNDVQRLLRLLSS